MNSTLKIIILIGCALVFIASIFLTFKFRNILKDSEVKTEEEINKESKSYMKYLFMLVILLGIITIIAILFSK